MEMKKRNGGLWTQRVIVPLYAKWCVQYNIVFEVCWSLVIVRGHILASSTDCASRARVTKTKWHALMEPDIQDFHITTVWITDQTKLLCHLNIAKQTLHRSLSICKQPSAKQLHFDK